MTEPTVLKPGYSPGIVPMLTELLRRAKAGEIAQIAVVHLNANGDDYGTWISDREHELPGGFATLKLVGAVADLQFTILQLHNQQQG